MKVLARADLCLRAVTQPVLSTKHKLLSLLQSIPTHWQAPNYIHYSTDTCIHEQPVPGLKNHLLKIQPGSFLGVLVLLVFLNV